MITIGVTGGIGSGKSVVCDIFRLHGVPVYDADKEAKELNDTSPVIRAELSRHFGEGLYREGRLDRKAFASIIFQDKQKVAVANAIIHPELAKDFLKWCSRQEQHHSMAIIDAALLLKPDLNVARPKQSRYTHPRISSATHHSPRPLVGRQGGGAYECPAARGRKDQTFRFYHLQRYSHH